MLIDGNRMAQAKRCAALLVLQPPLGSVDPLAPGDQQVAPLDVLSQQLRQRRVDGVLDMQRSQRRRLLGDFAHHAVAQRQQRAVARVVGVAGASREDAHRGQRSG